MAKAYVSVIWRSGPRSGRLIVVSGSCGGLTLAEGQGRVEGDRFEITSAGPSRLNVTIENPQMRPGTGATIVTIDADHDPFSFFLRDVSAKCPLIIPECGVAVTEDGDRRDYGEIAQAIAGLKSYLTQVDEAGEADFERAAQETRRMEVPTWLGLSRDFRIFQVMMQDTGHDKLNYTSIQPRYHSDPVVAAVTGGQPVEFNFTIGRGMGAVKTVKRRLEGGCLPILQGTIDERDIHYDFTMFVTLEKSALTRENVRGTHYLAADGCAAGHMFTPGQQTEFDALKDNEIRREEETVLYCQVVARNVTRAARYAWFTSPIPFRVDSHHFETRFDESGFTLGSEGEVYCVTKLNGQPMPQQEVAALIAPGDCATLEFRLPHAAISHERAAKLASFDFDERHAQCRRFWEEKLASAAQIQVPEPRIDEMIRAGLLHLDLIAYGLEPGGVLAPTIGLYSPIGSESAPIIQFMDSAGWHDIARRAIGFFLEKQHDDGMIQNFGGYMLETGAALWTAGEHYRYTRDRGWAQQIAPKVRKACDYLLAWRERNKREELRGKGYGLIDGKVADPPDPYRVYMLNGYACLGLSRAAEMLMEIDSEYSARLAEEARAFREDILEAVAQSLARSPAVPLEDGTWCPSMSPWAEGVGAACLFAEDKSVHTHGTFMTRDSLLGPLYLILQEVLDPRGRAAGWMLNYHAEMMTMNNVAMSQPYYSPHPWVHLKRGEVKPFLKAYYNAFAALADRETYTFWEHFFHMSPHKTHEEGWFLMQTRWMLYMEDGPALRLLPGIPRAWLAEGKRIALEGVASYFGPISLHVESAIDKTQSMRAAVSIESDRLPQAVTVRLPHPQGLKARKTSGGRYDAARECVIIDDFPGKADIEIFF